MDELKSPLRSPCRSPALSPNRSPNKSPNISPGRRSPISSQYESPPHGRHRSASIPVTPEALRGVRNRFLNTPGALYPLGESNQTDGNLLSVEAIERKGRLPRSAPELTIEEAPCPWNDDPKSYSTALAATVQRPATEVLSRRFSETLTVTDHSRQRRRSLKPQHSRSLSFRALKKKNGTEVEEYRPRGNSVPCTEYHATARNKRSHSMQRERERSLSPRPSVPFILDEDDHYYTLRNFMITAKGGVVNKGDLYRYRSRSNNSVASTASSVTGGGSSATSASSGQATQSMPKRVLMLGAVGVGKTALVTQFMSSEYMHSFESSLEEDTEKNVSVLLDGEENDLTFVDPSTHADFCADDSTSADAFIVVYSITDRLTFEKAVDILFRLRESGCTLSKSVILVGNKSDLVRSREITIEEGKSVACTYECKFIETSAAINHQVDELLVGIVKQIKLKKKQQEERLAFSESAPEPGSPVRPSCPSKKRMSLQSSGKKARGIINRLLGKGRLKSQSCGNLHVL